LWQTLFLFDTNYIHLVDELHFAWAWRGVDDIHIREMCRSAGPLEDTYEMLCIAITSDKNQRRTNICISQFFLIYAASLQAGFAVLCTGSMRIKSESCPVTAYHFYSTFLTGFV